MAEPIRIIGHDTNEQIQAQVDTSENLQVKEGAIKASNQVYESTSFSGTAIHDFNADAGRNSSSRHWSNRARNQGEVAKNCSVAFSSLT